MSDSLYFTRSGLTKIREDIEKLEKRLQDLQSQTAIVAEVGGDQWHDNSAYESLVIDIRGVDRRLAELHRILNAAKLVEPPTNVDKVTIGTKVKIICDGEVAMWEIVGFGESEPDLNFIAYNTPLAAIIMGRCKGEIVKGKIAGCPVTIEVLEIARAFS
ncbi:MAG: hypothetical protein A3H57_05005 [Candidatus Taylorbacteria bacterium RIFCSPLOWO2_02_FULL_43_11]|uniref:Transcription elongation factor GreA/GreB C-terminal domain-containing protein n=1 Tax=Candidatus Taylorbacteria bacterium RIFCSPHIGHO2_02_FULL_43_32b TaxID=1802306 RepID=A0A1G2ML40_9BACT|nr:MAG: hypothetical protein A2743_02945 [Candidatus Taylorbacteria bacterium RIFCSPHIGHO2_01_FULL_43_47]OHA23731.1 MAG: hypothetical protein A3C72_02375 [Candidatus Taylorbacteria bacterium RIFCSPHIGHO2_02_FULL_43_32b]OHA37328.1 MAG: hypothetical protein A3H57_05005 [Candidatus Taylorbacteria bacterium RIFCSPLOWO2_02_FULL_43_11]